MAEYENDFFKWTKTQTSLLKERRLAELDIDNLAEEIESLGKSDRMTLWNHMISLLLHLLKQKYHLEEEGNISSILDARMEIESLLENSPSLKNELKKIFPQAYEDAREGAAIEAKCDIDKFPKECPWSIQDVLNAELGDIVPF